ncbi:related to conserved hypothetical Ustilaginaceae-specific protein [Ustilago trichophora]|uniref:Related to conserved hypothetical Ustilaginaceae-specific protein n=1 Tax=Ustilago trichophora TaxID=86804 RepID=A0A5C3E4H5_9BASI|nr:related to conserved hypothetical Ustilaginaceae-specific protein [Ustilago trichophora]
MTFTNLFTIVLLGASIMLAEGHVTTGSETSTWEQRDFASCAKERIATMWDPPHKRPKGASAAICFSGDWHVRNRRPGHYEWVDRLTCKEKHGWITYKNRFDCFYLIGPNDLHMTTDGGSQNLAWNYNSNCEYYPPDKRLTCT